MAPVLAVGVAGRGFRRLEADARSASHSWPYGRAGGPCSTRPATIGDRRARRPANRADSRSGSWWRRDDRTGSLPGSGHQALDLGLGQIFAGTITAPAANWGKNNGWRDAADR